MFKSIYPFTQSVIAEYPAHDDQAIGKKLQIAVHTFNVWKKESFTRRADLMLRAGALLRQNKEQYARIISSEMGKVIAESRAEIEKCANACSFFAEQAEQLLKDQIIKTDASKSLIAFQPLGPVLAVMPWNFP